MLTANSIVIELVPILTADEIEDIRSSINDFLKDRYNKTNVMDAIICVIPKNVTILDE